MTASGGERVGSRDAPGPAPPETRQPARPAIVQLGPVKNRLTTGSFEVRHYSVLDTRLTSRSWPAEIVSGGGLAFKFKTAGCLATYLRQNPAESGTIFVTDCAIGRMLKATSATFVTVTLGTGSQQTRAFLAFQATADARAAAAQESTTTTDWAGVLASGN